VVKLRLLRELSSASEQTGARAEFEVTEEVSAVAVSGLLFFPAAPFFLLMKGGDIIVPKGTLVTAFIDGDLPLDRERFALPPAGATDQKKKEPSFGWIAKSRDRRINWRDHAFQTILPRMSGARFIPDRLGRRSSSG
jgi:hypothetical protein